MKNTIFAFLLVTISVLVACQPKTASNPPAANTATTTASNAKWNAYVEQFLADYFLANPSTAVFSGKHEQDGKIGDWSENGLKKEIARLKAEREKASAFKDADLDETQRFERDYLIAQIDKDLFWQETVDYPHTNPNYYSDALDPDVYVSRPYAPLETRIKAYTTYAKNVPAALAQIKANLKSPMAKNLVQIGRRTIGGLADFYAKDVVKVFEPVKDAASQKDFKEANDAAVKAIKEFDTWLGEQEKTANDGFALGAEKFKAMLKQTEGVDIDLAKLEEIAQADIKRNTDALKVECDKWAAGKTLAECMAKASADKAPGTNVVEAANNQLADLRKFIVEKDLMTIPGTEEAKVAQAPPYKAWNFA